jgi:predicted SAM-dependent methyltransferase
MISPVKAALYKQIRKDIGKASAQNINGTGIDVASSFFKNRSFFGSLQYVGIDISLDDLREGLKKYPEDIAIYADLSRHSFGQAYADIIVSSNTIEHLTSEDARIIFVHNILSALKESGVLIITVPTNILSEVLQKEIVSSFGNIYKSFFASNFTFNASRNLLEKWNEAKRINNCLLRITRKACLLLQYYSIYSLSWFTRKNDTSKRLAYFYCTNLIPSQSNVCRHPAGYMSQIERNLFSAYPL